jgi:hypothetical protein
MSLTDPHDLASRLKSSADAKKALMAKFQPKKAATDPLFEERAAMRAAELEKIRSERAAANAEKRQTAELARQTVADADEANAKDKRDARYAARKLRLRQHFGKGA